MGQRSKTLFSSNQSHLISHTSISNITFSSLDPNPENLFINKFRICLEIHRPSSLNISSNRTLSFPPNFFYSFPPKYNNICTPLIAKSVEGKGINNCFNWRLEIGSFSKQAKAKRSTIISMEEFLRDEFEAKMNLYSNVEESSAYIPFVLGRNERTSGVIHILRDFSPSESCNEKIEVLERVKVFRYQMDPTDIDATFGVVYTFTDASVVLISSIPTQMSPSALIHFIGEKHEKSIENIRLLKDSSPTRYMAIIKFSSQEVAFKFMNERNGMYFYPEKADICHILSVSSIEISTKAPLIEPFFDESEFAQEGLLSSLHSNQFVEIPSCPVCLERIDSTASGVMTVICNHKFHCQCLKKWQDSSCPVCRFAMDKSTEATCAECLCKKDIWCCLICGRTGCGRYQSGHAADHFLTTGHNFALQLDTHRVWDYIGDNYVHRIFHEKDVGKLVELPGPSESPKIDEIRKPDFDPEYYASLLAAQLESQRIFYEGRIDDLEMTFVKRVDLISKEHRREFKKLELILNEKEKEYSQQFEFIERQRQSLEIKLADLMMEKFRILKELESERAISRQASRNSELLQMQIHLKDGEVEDLNEQMKDLMTHLETQQKIIEHSRSELAQGTIYIPSIKSKKDETHRSRYRKG